MNAPRSTALFATAPFRAIELGAADVPDLQRFFEANPEYFLAVGGHRADPSEAHEEVHGTLPERQSITLRTERTDALLGLEVPSDEQAAILHRLGFDGDLQSGFLVPTWRARDVTREIDLIEEVARFRLTDIPFTLPRRDAMFGRLSRPQRLRRLVEDVLAGCGLSKPYPPTSTPVGYFTLPQPP